MTTSPVTWPDMSAPEPLDAEAPNLYVYLVIDARPHGQSGGIGWAGTDRDRAHEYARHTQGVVARLPVVGDYRNEEQR